MIGLAGEDGRLWAPIAVLTVSACASPYASSSLPRSFYRNFALALCALCATRSANVQAAPQERTTLRTLGKSPAGNFLDTKYKDKDEVKALGARWEPHQRKWYVPKGMSLRPFARWLPQADQPHAAGLQGHSPDTNHASARQQCRQNSGTYAPGGYTTTRETSSAEQTHGRAQGRGGVQGALQVDTRKYVPPFQACRDKEYACIECKGKVILKRGSIRVPHFAHYHNNSGIACGYYEHPGESQLHKDAKEKLRAMLQQQREISVIWNCAKCGYRDGGRDRVQYQEGDSVIVEYRDPAGKYRADVALVSGDAVRYIFEVMNTHATDQEHVSFRPEPWFEIKVDSLPDSDWTNISLTCERTDQKRFCADCQLRAQSPYSTRSQLWYGPSFVYNTGRGALENSSNSSSSNSSSSNRNPSRCWGNGMCLYETRFDDDLGFDVHCPWKCLLHKCAIPSCGTWLPQMELDSKGGRCLGHDMEVFMRKRIIHNRQSDTCFDCGERGHWAKECVNAGFIWKLKQQRQDGRTFFK